MKLLFRNIESVQGILFILPFVVSLLCGCSNKSGNRVVVTDNTSNHGGDSAVVIKSRNPQNGFLISFIHKEKDDVILLSKDDSTNYFLETERLPLSLCEYEDSAWGVYHYNFIIPVVQLDTLDIIKYNIPEAFFMDVNFDGKEEFVFALEGNGKLLYDCYDIENAVVDGKSSVPIKPMREEPYCRFASGLEPTIKDCVVFDHQKKEIFIYTTSGYRTAYYTWAKYFENENLRDKSCVRLVKQQRFDFDNENMTETVETYIPHGDSLKLLNKKTLKY